MSDSMRMAALIHMCPAKLQEHLQLNAVRFTTYLELREEVFTYLDQVAPVTATTMDVGSLDKRGCFLCGGPHLQRDCKSKGNGKKGAKRKDGKGKSKDGGGKGKGKSKFDGKGKRSWEEGRTKILPELWQGWSSQRTVLAQVNQTIECGGPSIERAAVSICSGGYGGVPAQKHHQLNHRPLCRHLHLFHRHHRGIHRRVHHLQCRPGAL